jgi:phosphocarrier protein
MNKTFIMIDEAGLHARPASLMSQAASKFTEDITIEYNGKKVNLKSIMCVMSLGVPQGGEITIEVSGDAPEAVFEALEAIMVEHKLV